MRTDLRAALCGVGAGALLATSAAVGAPAALGSSTLVAACGGTVTGATGQAVDVSGSSVLAVLPAAAHALSGVVSALSSPVPVGSVGSSNSTVSGGSVAGAVVSRISDVPLVTPLLGPIRDAVANGCAVTVDVIQTVATPVVSGVTRISPQLGKPLSVLTQPVEQPAVVPAQQPAAPVAAAVPAASAAQLAPVFAIPAQVTSLGYDFSQLFGALGPMSFGVTPYADYASLYTLSGFDPTQLVSGLDFSAPAATGATGTTGTDSRVVTTSQVQALPTASVPGRVGLQVLLAALAVAAVAAVLARGLALRWSRKR